MADETQGTPTQAQDATPQENATATETKAVTDEALSSAWDASQSPTEPKADNSETANSEGEPKGQPGTEGDGETQGQEQTETEQHEEPADNAERSRLGRRLKATEDKLDAILARLEQAAPRQEEAAPAQPQKQAVAPDNVTYDDSYMQREIEAAIERGDIPATIVTPSDQLAVNRFVNGLQDHIRRQYAVNYLNVLKTPTLKGDTPDDIHAEVLSELQKVDSPFNRRQYDNPSLDAQMNYKDAKIAILQKRMAEGKPAASVFKGKPKDGPATGTAVSTRTATATNELPPLDEASLDFIKRTGMSVDSVNKSLKGDMPFHLRGGLR